MTSKENDQMRIEAVDIDQKDGAEMSEAEQIKELAANELDPKEEKHLVWKLDRHIAPVAMGLYLIAFLDRANIGNAAVGGMTEDLNFPANGLSVATSIFYVTYVLFETPATMLLRSLKPKRLIPAVVIIWGGISLANGFCKTYAQVLACRLLLGVCEAALSPCLVLYMTTFYRREELALRLCYLYMSSALSGVIGGLIAAGFLKMDGLQGLRGWQWLYIIEGAITILVGIIVFFAIANTYQSARYLNKREKWMMSVRQAQEAAFNHDDGFSWVEIRKAFTDPVIWLSGFVQLGLDVCLYGYSTFLVVIINQFGFDRISSQGITAPVYFFCALTYFIGALVSMRYQIRYFVLLPLAIITAIGYAVLIGYPPSVGGQLVGCFLAGAGIYICVGLHVTWLGQNVAGFRKRSVSVGLQQTVGNTGGVVAGQIYRSVDKPRYTIGHGVSLAFWVLAIAGMTAEYFIWKSRNAAREQMSAEDKDEMDVRGITGDQHYSFRYAL
ncbi:hypothetical protein CcaverHIS002_0410700 [Cutaneotrichosporon cavernicola]|uniref:Major facilitator superfamily (MFS) profile domain-containing protein n=1 Tax=Cutaneotrichosporon cavernicola TaxID=279322 RepID=A0AA48L5C5_9TREE|nr:uncharacterized protein CcaverHIS019_0410600 [Cutaneotrichosporon cavernicola]BEI84466.1 hypothetical protein CcaverHIS002_0410700 [Cutaneotrichosporon cavernicola]BEI92240.1 hypothetical protein CcaverHIS019_0410600 [Cutaneotrichosporon cavernicola]BEJ00012.1 hypothetical protein CcaverHIS631_0410540 [Cutaneotrichosporon cavernicola]BEJ07784.1 hypothetical protein CcaverHIS641_0410530 [Cutaneotrichosporon cavernicola]